MKSRSAFTILRLAASITLLWVVLRYVDLEPVLQAVRRADLRMVLLGIGTFLVSFAVFAKRLQALLRITGQHVPYLRLLGINFVGAFFSLLLPTTVGGDVARVYKLSRRATVGSHGLTCILVDRILGLSTLLLMAIVALVLGRSVVPESELMVVSAIGLGLLVGGLLLLVGLSRIQIRAPDPEAEKPESWRARLQSVQESFLTLTSDPTRLSGAMLLSILGQIISVYSVSVLAEALGIDIPTGLFFIVVPVVWLVVSVPITIGGLGARESAYILLLGRLGIASAPAVALSLLIYSCYLVCGFIGATGMMLGAILGTREHPDPVGHV